MKWWVFSSGKSGKREVAGAILTFWGFISARHFMWVDAVTHASQNDAWTTLTWVSLAWAAGAWGIDFAVKSGILGGGKQPDREQPERRPRQSERRQRDPDQGVD